MTRERQLELREKAQEALTSAQDHWIEVVERHGRDYRNPAVALAKKRLDDARLSYLSLTKDKL